MSTATTTHIAYLTSTPRAGGKLAITVEIDGVKATKVTARTYHYIVVSYGLYATQWDAKANEFVSVPNVVIKVLKGTGDIRVAHRAFDAERATNARLRSRGFASHSRGVAMLALTGSTSDDGYAVVRQSVV